jgi:GNAT superfamily N-acetyltransferase
LSNTESDLIIRYADEQALPDLLCLYEQLHPSGAKLSLEDAAGILHALPLFPGSGIFVGYCGERLATSCTLTVIPNLTWSGRPYALIENVITDSSLRNRGFGRTILQHATSQAWLHGCYKVMLMTGSKSPATLKFYTEAGFEQTKTGFQIRRVPERQM